MPLQRMERSEANIAQIVEGMEEHILQRLKHKETNILKRPEQISAICFAKTGAKVVNIMQRV